MENLTLSNNFFVIAAGAMLVILFAEAWLAGSWNRLYFTVGLPIFIKRVPVSVFSFPPLDFGCLEAEFSATWTSKSLVFKELEPNLFAFREKLLEMRWGKSSSEVMHGLLILDQNQQQVVVKGFANLWMLGMAVLFALVSLAIGPQGLLLAAAYVVIMGVVYLLQARRFGKVAQFVAEQVKAGRAKETNTWQN